MLDKLLEGSKDDLIGSLTSKLGVSDDQAGGFLATLFEHLEQLLKSDKLDVQQLLSGDTSGIKEMLNLETLGALLGGGADKGEQGVEAVGGAISEQLGGSQGLMDQLQGLLGGAKKDGGALDAAADIAGKIFGD